MMYELRQGDSLLVMKSIEDNVISAVITDPPYGLKFMGKDWDDGVPGVGYWRECLRVSMPGAHLLAFGGTRKHHRLACHIEDAGWELRDTLMWVYGSGFPKSHNISKALGKSASVDREVVEKWRGWGTTLKPAWEPIILARKPLSGTVTSNVMEWGVGGLNIAACTVGDETIRTLGKRNGSGRSLNWSEYKSDENWVGETRTGRWPANLVHDGSADVMEAFGETPVGICLPCAGDGCESCDWTGCVYSAGVSRFFYCAKASREDRDEGCEDLPQKGAGIYAQDEWSRKNMGNTPDAKRRLVYNDHPTVKPTELMKWLVRIVTPIGGVVLDPFAGSGSTGKAAMLEGCRFFGIDLDPGYLEIAQKRIEYAMRKRYGVG